MSINDIIKECIELNIKLSKQQDNLKVDAPKGLMSSQLLSSIKDNKQALLEFLQKYASEQQRQTLSRVYPEATQGPLSSGQSQMWFLDKMFKNNENYQFYRVLHITGSIDTDILEQSFDETIARHTILRTTYQMNKQAVEQCIGDGLEFKVNYLDLQSHSEAEQQSLIEDAAKQFKQAAFELDSDLMIRALLIKTQSDGCQLHLKFHHIATDGWSLALIVKEFTDIYTSLAQGVSPAKNDAFQYIDYAKWQQSDETKQAIAQHLSFFEGYLDDAPQMHNLPINASNRSGAAKAALVQQSLDANVTQSLKAFCQQHGVTVFSFIQFGLSILISHYSDRTDTIMGTPMANRPLNELGKVIGFFVNTLPLRTQIDPQESFITALKNQHLNVLDMMEKQIVPFGQIVQHYVTHREPGVAPLTQVMFSLQNEDIPTLRLGQSEIAIQTPKTDSTDFDLSIKCTEEHGQVNANWIYAEGLFEHAFIEQVAAHLNRLVEYALVQPECSIERLYRC